MNRLMETMFTPEDPFVTETRLLCQQIGWHYEDLEPHCDREREDKSFASQEPADDGVGDRITSLTLRRG